MVAKNRGEVPQSKPPAGSTATILEQQSDCRSDF